MLKKQVIKNISNLFRTLIIDCPMIDQFGTGAKTLMKINNSDKSMKNKTSRSGKGIIKVKQTE